MTERVPLVEPFDLFGRWLAEAEDKEINDPTAMALATVRADGQPSVRMVLLKGADVEGFVFYTNLGSDKARQLRGNAKAALCFHWKSIRRQVRVEGAVAPVSDEEADAYFASRPRASRIGAWASHQSKPLKSGFDLEKRVAEFTAKFAVGAVPRPEFWSGYRLSPDRLEFWRDRPFRLHDRTVYNRDDDGWKKQKLYP